MKSEFPVHRFEEFGPLSTAERAALREIVEAPVQFARHAQIRGEAETPHGFFLLFSGWAAASQTLTDGGRQILKVHLPGDALGTPSICMVRTAEELSAVTDVTVAHVPFERFASLFEQHPRIAMKFMLSVQLERIALMDRLTSIGRTSARQRIAAFIIDIMGRLEPLGLVHDNMFFMALTQEQIADVVGLTSVHTNRALMALTRHGFISRTGAQYTIRDRAGLARLAALPARTRHVDPPWLPKAR